VYPHIGDFTNLVGYPPLKPKISSFVSIQGRLQDDAKVEDFKYLSKGKIFLVPTLSLSPLCPRTSNV
jgi:hypothetical protein